MAVPGLKGSRQVKERMNLSPGGSQTPALLPVLSQGSAHPGSPSPPWTQGTCVWQIFINCAAFPCSLSVSFFCSLLA